MSIINKKNRFWSFGIAFVACVILAGMIGCKQDPPLSEIEVSNECGVAIDVFMDGIFKFSIEFGFIKTIKNVEWGTYLFEARKSSSGALIISEELSVRINEILRWRVWSYADIKITNNYGETLNIYGDNVYVGEIEDQSYSLMENVPYGDRKLEARLSDNTVVASATIAIEDNIIYEWTIVK